MAWRRSGDKPLSEPMMVNLLTHICVTRPQWVKTALANTQLLAWHFYIPCAKWNTETICKLDFSWATVGHSSISRVNVQELPGRKRYPFGKIREFTNATTYINGLAYINLLAPGRCGCNLELVFFKLISRKDVFSISCEIALGECLETSLMISQHWFRNWLGAIKQQAITWANSDPNLCCHIITRPQWVNCWIFVLTIKHV